MSDEIPLRRQNDQILSEVRDKVDKIYSMLIGDGTTGNPGVMIRLDRLEQSASKAQDDEKEKRAWRWGLAGSIVLLVIERLWHYFFMHK